MESYINVDLGIYDQNTTVARGIAYSVEMR